MSIALGIARMIGDIRFQYFPYIPEREKVDLFFKLIRVPMHNEPVVQTIASAAQANRWVQLKYFIRALTKHKMLKPLDHRKDYETVRGLYFAEQDETFATNLLVALHGFAIESPEDQILWNSVLNLLFSATCRQDKIAALLLLATK